MGQIYNIETKKFDATNLTGSAQNLGSATSNPVKKVSFFNTSDVSILVGGFDGDDIELASNATLTLDENTSNQSGRSSNYYLRKGAQLTVTEVTGAGSSGDLIAILVTEIL